MRRFSPGRRLVALSLGSVPLVALMHRLGLGKDLPTVSESLDKLDASITSLENTIELAEADLKPIEEHANRIEKTVDALLVAAKSYTGENSPLEQGLQAMCTAMFDIANKTCSQAEKERLFLEEMKKFERCAPICNYSCSSGGGGGRIFKGDGRFLRAAAIFGFFALRIGLMFAGGGGGIPGLGSISPR